MDEYLKSCKTEFWSNVFKAELEYILEELKGTKEVLSVGCGPAIIEAGLAEQGFNVTGLDISNEVLNQAPDSIRTVVGPAENMDFEDGSFDAVIYVASLQFIKRYQEAIRKTVDVLRPDGKLIVMLLNPVSEFFKEKLKNPGSYVNKIKHINLCEIEAIIAKYFIVKTEYFLGIRERDIFETRNPKLSSLYVIKGDKKQ
ncbi:MAG: class I SAM-dependent methyltransferase [Sedimentisphaerales bacterium]|nr:class I SAM-dependent methyltransferase [Sedimentisphaerales bacterium]